jgi:hypothetical protein
MNNEEFTQATTLTDEEKVRIKNAISYPNGAPLKGESEIDYKNRWIVSLQYRGQKLFEAVKTQLYLFEMGESIDAESLDGALKEYIGEV